MVARLGLLLVCVAVACPFALNPMPSPDLWWYLSDGRLVAQTAAIPMVDVLSFTAEGQAWQNDEWLVCWLFYLVYSAGGLGALYVLKVALLGLTLFFLVWHASLRAESPGWLAAGVAAGCLLFSEYRAFFDVRSYLFTYLFLALFWVVLYRLASSRDVRWCWAFPVLTVVWINLHAGVTAGLAMLAAATVGMLLEKAYRPLAGPLALSTGASLAATGLTPMGYEVLTYSFRLTSSVWKQHLNEWQPLFSAGAWRPGIEPYLGFLAATAVVGAVLYRRLHAYEGLVLAAFAFLSFTGWRHVPLFCLLAIFPWTVAAASLVRARELPARAWAGLGALAAVFLLVTARTTAVPVLSLENQLFPRWAVQFLEANRLPPALFAPYGWGGYLGWKLYPDYRVFIDGRAADVYPAQVYLDYLDIAFDTPRAHELLDTWGVKTALVFRSARMKEASSLIFDDHDDWTRIYEDHLAAIYLKGPVPELVRPPNPYNLTAEGRQALLTGDPATAAERLRQALALDPRYGEAVFLQGVMALRAGRDLEGVALVEKALAFEPSLLHAHYVLAAHFAASDPARARREALAELEVNPDSQPARKLLQQLNR